MATHAVIATASGISEKQGRVEWWVQSERVVVGEE